MDRSQSLSTLPFFDLYWSIYVFLNDLSVCFIITISNDLQFTPKLKPLDRFYGRRSDLDVQILQIIFSVSLWMHFLLTDGFKGFKVLVGRRWDEKDEIYVHDLNVFAVIIV